MLDPATDKAVVAVWNKSNFVVQVGGVNNVRAQSVEHVLFSSGSASDTLTGGMGDGTLVSFGGGPDHMKGLKGAARPPAPEIRALPAVS